MVKSTVISRLADGLPLAASMDDEEVSASSSHPYNVSHLHRTVHGPFGVQDPNETAPETSESAIGATLLNRNGAVHVSVPPPTTHLTRQSYIIDQGVCYLTLCDKSYAKKLAFGYLEELLAEFQEKYGTEVGSVARPYAFVKFDTFIQKVKKQYKDTRTNKNLNKLNDDLSDVQRIMTRNIQDILGRGEQLDRMKEMSHKLSDESKKYLKDTKKLRLMALYQKYAPPVIVTSIVLLILYLRFYWW